MTYIVKIGVPMRPRIFDNPRKLKKLLTLARNGVKFGILCEIFKADRKTIWYHLKRHGVIIPKLPPVPRASRAKIKRLSTASSPIVKTAVPHLDEYGSLINEGKNYRDYLEPDLLKREEEAKLNLARRIEEENNKSKFCDNSENVLIRMRW